MLLGSGGFMAGGEGESGKGELALPFTCRGGW